MAPPQPMSAALVVIEGPGKRHALQQALKAYDPRTTWTVLATSGHLRDLPKKTLGVDTKRNFELEWVPRRSDFPRQLRTALPTVQRVYVATDADREGEEIADAVWSLLPKRNAPPTVRLRIRSITPEGVRDAFQALADNDTLDTNLVQAQHARRALDRLFGYTLSPKCWRFLGPGMATGRVQACVLHKLVTHAKVRRDHEPVDQTLLSVPLKSTPLRARSAALAKPKQAQRILASLREGAPRPTLETRTVEEHPPRPYTTAALLRLTGLFRQDAASLTRDLQALYERGLISYPRTDNPSVSPAFAKHAHAYFTAQDPAWWGGFRAGSSKVKRASSEAHEAIRPTSLHNGPSSARAQALPPTQQRLYRYIWARTVASFGVSARRTLTRATFETPHGSLTAEFSVYAERGYHAPSMGVFLQPEHPMPEKLRLLLDQAEIDTHEKPPPPHETTATMIRWMETHRVGRPATYAATLDKLQYHGVMWAGGHVGASQRGDLLDEFLRGATKELLDPDFTAAMEKDLDRIARGNATYEDVVRTHWDWLQQHLPQEGLAGPACPTCQKPTRIKVGRRSAPFAHCGKCKKDHPVGWNRPRSPLLLPWSPQRYCTTCKKTTDHTTHPRNGTLVGACKGCKTQTVLDRL